MNYKGIKNITLYILFIYIIIFSAGTSQMLNRIGLALVIGFGGLYCCLNKLQVKKNIFLCSMSIYGLMAWFAKIYSISPESKVTVAFNGYISMFFVIFVVILVVDTEKDIEFLLNAFALASLVQCVYMLSVYGTDIISVIVESEEGMRIGDEVSNSNSVGISFAIGYIISLYFLLNEKMSFYKKIFYAILVIVGFVFGLLSGSRKALILLLIGSFIILFLKNATKKNIIKTFFGILLACTVMYIMYDLISSNPLFSTVNDRFTSLTEGLQNNSKLDYSSKERFYMIKTGWTAFMESPLIGKGLYASYKYFATYSHNNFIEILMNTGIIGFAIFYYPYMTGLYDFTKINRNEKLYSVMLVIFLWVLLGGYGMVTYYSKNSMTLMALVSIWLSIKRSKKNE